MMDSSIHTVTIRGHELRMFPAPAPFSAEHRRLGQTDLASAPWVAWSELMALLDLPTGSDALQRWRLALPVDLLATAPDGDGIVTLLPVLGLEYVLRIVLLTQPLRAALADVARQAGSIGGHDLCAAVAQAIEAAPAVEELGVAGLDELKQFAARTKAIIDPAASTHRSPSAPPGGE